MDFALPEGRPYPRCHPQPPPLSGVGRQAAPCSTCIARRYDYLSSSINPPFSEKRSGRPSRPSRPKCSKYGLFPAGTGPVGGHPGGNSMQQWLLSAPCGAGDRRHSRMSGRRGGDDQGRGDLMPKLSRRKPRRAMAISTGTSWRSRTLRMPAAFRSKKSSSRTMPRWSRLSSI